VIFDIYKPHVCGIEETLTKNYQKIDNKKNNNEYINNETDIEPNIGSKMLNARQYTEPHKLVEDNKTPYVPKNNKRKKYIVNDDLPSQTELYSIVLELTKKCDKLQQDVTNMKQQLSNRFKRDIADYLQYDQRPKYTFLEWVNTFVVTDEILNIVFNTDLFDGIRKCINDRIENEGIFSIPIRVFKEKPDWIFIYTNEPIKNNKNKEREEKCINEKIKCIPVEIQLSSNEEDFLKTPVWRMVSKSNFNRVKEYVTEHILKKFYIWETENEPKMKHSSEKMDILASYMLKVIGHGSKQKKERQNAELYKWFFSKIAIV